MKPKVISSVAKLDCTECKRGLWLVKVPKYLSEHWRNLAGQGEVGRLNVVTQTDTRTGIPKDEVFFKTTKSLTCSGTVGTSYGGGIVGNSFGTGAYPNASNLKAAQDSTASSALPIGGGSRGFSGSKDLKTGSVPDEHRFVIGNTSHLTLAVFSEDKTDLEESQREKRSGHLCLEGRIVKRAECRPPKSQDYMKMKISQIEDFSRPTRSIQQMDKAVIKFKPVAIHQEMVAKEKQRKEGKTVRMDKDKVMELLFEAFEKHQYYKLVDLAKITNQPPSYIKELLNEIGKYNTAPPHKYLWELKLEYRHYKGDQQQEQEDEDDKEIISVE